MTKIIALFNQAGGVGKTTITHNLGYHLSQKGHQVLLIDLDPQSSPTPFVGIDPEKLEKTPFDALINEEPLFIIKTNQGFDLVPTNITLSVAEIQLVNLDFREIRLKDALSSVQSDYTLSLLTVRPVLDYLAIPVWWPQLTS
jgi:chromosome partitioning protein